MISKRQIPALFCLFGMLGLGSSSSFAACPDATKYPHNGCSMQQEQTINTTGKGNAYPSKIR